MINHTTSNEGTSRVLWSYSPFIQVNLLSDRGTIYGSLAFRELLVDNDITPSMSRKGNCYDNAVAESFFHTIKVELIRQNEYKLKVSAIFSICKWI